MKKALFILALAFASCNKDCPEMHCIVATLPITNPYGLPGINTTLCEYEDTIDAFYNKKMNGEFEYRDSTTYILCEL